MFFRRTGQNPARQAMISAGIPRRRLPHDQQGLCFRPQGHRPGSTVDPVGRCRRHGGRGYGKHEPGALCVSPWPLGGEDVQPGDGGPHGLRRTVELFYGYHMGLTAENIAEKFGISRKEQDELGLLSHQRQGLPFRAERSKRRSSRRDSAEERDPLSFDTDERPMDTSLEKMGNCPRRLRRGHGHAGNASGLNDAAAAVLMMSKEKAKELNLEPMERSGPLPQRDRSGLHGPGPIPAVKKALKKAGVSLKDIGLIELNEAFASQAIACVRELKFDMDKTNINGSGISLGHPIGCSGARLIVTLLHEMKRKQVNLGLATLCIGGGQGMAMIIEK